MQPKIFDNQIESLRGFMAIIVVVHHFTNIAKNIDPGFVPTWLEYVNLPGHIAVLVFFVLSGYLIGLTNKSRMTLSGILPYLKKRIVRLYPIYALCIALTLIFVNSQYPITQIAANFAFLQVMFSPVIKEILPIWSLNFEVFYYLLFIIVALLGAEPILLMIVSVIIGVVGFFMFPNLAVVSGVAFGCCFWMAGLAIARYCTTRKPEHETNYPLLLSNIFLLFALDRFNVFTTVLHYAMQVVFHNDFNNLATSNLAVRVTQMIDLALLPYCAIFVILFAGLKIKHERLILLTLQLLPLLTLKAVLFPKEGRDMSVYMMPGIYYAISLLLFFAPARKFNNLIKPLMGRMAFLGSISFALYIIHVPIMELVKQTPFLSGTPLTYSLRVIIVVVATGLISWLLELRYQPWIRKYLVGKPKV